jgi:hypothetical protein
LPTWPCGWRDDALVGERIPVGLYGQEQTVLLPEAEAFFFAMISDDGFVCLAAYPIIDAVDYPKQVQPQSDLLLPGDRLDGRRRVGYSKKKASI